VKQKLHCRDATISQLTTALEKVSALVVRIVITSTMAIYCYMYARCATQTGSTVKVFAVLLQLEVTTGCRAIRITSHNSLYIYIPVAPVAVECKFCASCCQASHNLKCSMHTAYQKLNCLKQARAAAELAQQQQRQSQLHNSTTGSSTTSSICAATSASLLEPASAADAAAAAVSEADSKPAAQVSTCVKHLMQVLLMCNGCVHTCQCGICTQ
jgi:hypothetical protein